MPDIQTGRFGRLLQSVFNLKQRMTLGQTLPDVMPVFSLDKVAPEYQLHVRDDLCAAYVTQAAVAAQYSKVALQMPLGSGKICVIEELIIVNTNASALVARVGLGSGTAYTDGGTLEQFCDVRTPGRPVCTTRATTTGAATGGDLAVYSIPTNESLTVRHPFVLGTGLLTGAAVASFLRVEAGSVNQALTVNFRWRERLLEPQENVLS